MVKLLCVVVAGMALYFALTGFLAHGANGSVILLSAVAVACIIYRSLITRSEAEDEAIKALQKRIEKGQLNKDAAVHLGPME